MNVNLMVTVFIILVVENFQNLPSVVGVIAGAREARDVSNQRRIKAKGVFIASGGLLLSSILTPLTEPIINSQIGGPTYTVGSTLLTEMLFTAIIFIGTGLPLVIYIALAQKVPWWGHILVGAAAGLLMGLLQNVYLGHTLALIAAFSAGLSVIVLATKQKRILIPAMVVTAVVSTIIVIVDYVPRLIASL